jgi:hypothetical protein
MPSAGAVCSARFTFRSTTMTESHMSASLTARRSVLTVMQPRLPLRWPVRVSAWRIGASGLFWLVVLAGADLLVSGGRVKSRRSRPEGRRQAVLTRLPRAGQSKPRMTDLASPDWHAD